MDPAGSLERSDERGLGRLRRGRAPHPDLRGLPGVRFVPVCFTPDSSKFKDEECGGVNVIVTERARLRPVRTGIEIAAVLRQLYPDHWETERLNRLLCDQQVFESIVAGESPDSIEAGYGPELRDFRRRRNGFLLY